MVALSGAERARAGRLRRSWAEGEVSAAEWEWLGKAARAAVIVERLFRIDTAAFAEARADARACAIEAGADDDESTLAVAAALPNLRTLTMLARQTTRWDRAIPKAIGAFDRLRRERLRRAKCADEPKGLVTETSAKSRVAADRIGIGAHAVEPTLSAEWSESGGRRDDSRAVKVGTPTATRCRAGADARPNRKAWTARPDGRVRAQASRSDTSSARTNPRRGRLKTFRNRWLRQSGRKTRRTPLAGERRGACPRGRGRDREHGARRRSPPSRRNTRKRNPRSRSSSREIAAGSARANPTIGRTKVFDPLGLRRSGP